MLSQTGALKCICVFVLLQTATAKPVQEEEDAAGSVFIDIVSSDRYFEFTEGQLMSFKCTMTGGDEQKAQIVLSIGGVVKNATSFGERTVHVTKVAEERDNYRHVECKMRYKDVQDTYTVSRALNVFYSPRMAAEDLSTGTYVAIGDFRVGEGANVTVRVRANPKPNGVNWTINGKDLDLERFQPWTTDQLLFEDGSWVAGLSISKVELDDFQSVFQLEVTNDHGRAVAHVVLNKRATPGWTIIEVGMLIFIVLVAIYILISCRELFIKTIFFAIFQ